MHLALQLAPFAAEKSRVPFYVAGGLLVLWALVVSMAVGMRRPGFPSSLGQQRALSAISVVLVLGAVSTAVITSGSPAKTEEAGAAGLASPNNGETSSSGGTSSTTKSTEGQPGQGGQAEPQPKSTATAPTATTGTPAPPSSPAASSASKVALAADPAGQLAFDAKTLSAKAGTVTITMTNMSPVEHNVTIAQGAKTLGATPSFLGGTRTLTLKLKAGTYTFFCSVPGHRQAGMEGTLKVSP